MDISGIRPTEVDFEKNFDSSVKITSCFIFIGCVVFKIKLSEKSSVK